MKELVSVFFFLPSYRCRVSTDRLFWSVLFCFVYLADAPRAGHELVPGDVGELDRVKSLQDGCLIVYIVNLS